MDKCVMCGGPLTEEQMDHGEKFCSRECEWEVDCANAEATWFEDAAYGTDAADEYEAWGLRRSYNC